MRATNFYVPRSFNPLPHEVQRTDSLKTFKRQMRKHCAVKRRVLTFPHSRIKTQKCAKIKKENLGVYWLVYISCINEFSLCLFFLFLLLFSNIFFSLLRYISLFSQKINHIVSVEGASQGLAKVSKHFADSLIFF